MTITSTFDTDTEGWTTSDNSLTWDDLGRIIGIDQSTNTWQFVAPAAYLGDRESYYGGTISFDLGQTVDTNQYDGQPDVTLFGAGMTLVIEFPNNPPVGYLQPYSVHLEFGFGWRVGAVDGPLASAEQIRAVLSDLTGFHIRGEFQIGADRSILDNVLWEEGSVLMAALSPRILSDFSSGLQGWSFVGDVAAFEAEGDTSPEYLAAIDAGLGDFWYWAAPDVYLGDKSEFYGGRLSFDLAQSDANGQLDEDDVILTGGGLTIAFDISPPGTDWTSYSVRLDTSEGWRVGSEDGPLASEAQIRQVLGDLETLYIRGEYSSAIDTGLLDNVLMEVFHQVEHFDGSGFASLFGRYPTLADAIGQAAAGDSLRVTGAPTEPADPIGIAQDNLTIEAVQGYVAGLALTDDARMLTLLGGAAFAVAGTSGNDLLVGGGNSGSLTFNGGVGNDTVYGGTGIDYLFGEDGDDVLAGGLGDDQIIGGGGRNALWGGPGGDSIEGGSSHDTLGGGDGADGLFGHAGNDALWTGAGDDFASGGDDNDTLGGAGGDDYLDGGSGDDDLWGSTGSDQLFGGSGNDLLGGFTGDDLLSGGFGDDEIWGSAGNDTAAGGDGADQIGGGADNDYVSGGADNDSLYGGLGDDFVGGGAGDDLIYGAAGDDSLDGGAGNDTIYAGPGNDTVVYGDGADELQFFSATADRLELDAALWGGGLTAAQVVSTFGSTVGSDFVLDFGGGDAVTLVGLGGVTGLESQIDIV